MSEDFGLSGEERLVGAPLRPQIRLQILGPLQLRRDGVELAVPPQQALLLAVLLARAGRPVTADELIDLIWGDGAPPSALNTLHRHIGALRHLLEPGIAVRQEGSYLKRRGNAYVFTADAETLDLTAFRSLLSAARVALAEQRFDAALDAYVQALALRTGSSGSGLDGGTGAAQIFEALDAEFMEQAVAATALAVSLGRPERVLPAVQAAAAMGPLHEPVQASLVAALGAAGRRAEALTVFHTVRTALVEQLGIDPGQALTAAYRRVLEPPAPPAAASRGGAFRGTESGDAASGGESVRDNRAQPASQDRTVAAEPYRVADFRGRPAELEAIRSFIGVVGGTPRAASALLITGPPGAGKTTTVLEALHGGDASASRLFVNLHGFDPSPLSPLQVLRAVLLQVNAGEEPPGTLDEASAAWRSAADARPLVIVLDNASAESQVRPVLSTDRKVAVIVTSRRALPGLESTTRLPLGPLPRSESRELLAALIPPSRRTDADLDTLAELCGDLPLALRISGARIASRPQWDVADFIDRLRDEQNRLQQLVAGDLAVETAFSLSYDALPPDARRLFRSLALLHGHSFTARMVAAIDDRDPRACRDQLDALADLGLVELGRGDRYRMHDLLRIYAADRLRDETASAEVRRQQSRLDAWILAATAEAAMTLPRNWGPLPIVKVVSRDALRAASDWLKSESSHWFGALRSAAERGEHRLVVDTAMALLGPSIEWAQWGHWSDVHSIGADSAFQLEDGDAYVVQLLAVAEAAGEEPVQTVNPVAASEVVGLEAKRAPARRALEAAEVLDRPRWAAWARYFIAHSYYIDGYLDGVLTEARRAATEFARHGDVSGEIEARALIVRALIPLDPAEALREAESSMAVLDGLGPRAERTVQANAFLNILNAISRLYLSLERYEETLAISTRMMELPDSFLDGEGIAARALRHRGLALLGLGRTDEAREALESALALAGAYRPDPWAAEIEEALASVAAR